MSVGSRLRLVAQTAAEVPIKGIVFDMDGTLSQPQTWMFGKMREALGINGKKIDIIDQMASLEGDARFQAEKAIKDIEHEAMELMEPQTGLAELFEYLESIKLPKTICTRNNMTPVDHLKANILPSFITISEPIVTRDFNPPKPSPLPLLHISKTWDISPENMIMVGDSRDDMLAGLNAGFAVILMKHKDNAHLLSEIPMIDYAVDSLAEIIALLENGFIKKPRDNLHVVNAGKTSGY